MNLFIKAVSAVLIALFLSAMLEKQSKDLALLLTVATCSLILIVTIQQFEPVIQFFKKIQLVGQLDSSLLKIILKVVGIGLLSEVISLLCFDNGNASMGKTVQLLASCVMLCISLPLFNALLDLIEEILKFL